jgi:hypothetical protein
MSLGNYIFSLLKVGVLSFAKEIHNEEKPLSFGLCSKRRVSLIS